MADLLNVALTKPNNSQYIPQAVPAIKLDLNANTKIHPENPTGYLVKSRIFGSPIEYVKDLGKDVASIKKGVTGKANDYELGRMNDLAMKTGSLGLAAYLFTKGNLNMKKAMEFVGFGTFFGAMALWPKLFIQAPIKAMTGVDIHQKYVDSFGRKKMLLQDPQYVPMNLFSKDQMNEMGDKLGIAKDVPNRDEVTEQKMRKIGIQGNTLWMMTAGFATPLMGALASNLSEPLILKFQQQLSLGSTEKAIAKLEQYQSGTLEKPEAFIAKYKNTKGEAALKDFFKNNADLELNNDSLKQVVSQIVDGNDLNLEMALHKDLMAYVKPSPRPVTTAVKTELSNALSNVFAKYDGLDSKIISNYFDAKGADFVVDSTNLKSVIKELSVAIGNEIVSLNKETSGFKFNLTDKTRLQKTLDGALTSIVSKHNAPTISSIEEVATQVFKSLDDVTAQRRVVDKFIDVRVGDKAETFIANTWGKITKKTVNIIRNADEKSKLKTTLKNIGFDNKELDALRNPSEKSLALLDKKLTALAKNEDAYKKAISEISKLISEYDSKTTELNDVASKQLKKVIGSGAESLAKTGLNLENSVNLLKDSSSRYATQHVEDRINGAKYSLYRLVQTMDLYKRLDNIELPQELSGLKNINLSDVSGKELLKILSNNVDGIDEEVAKRVSSDIFKELGISFDASAYSVKKAEYDSLIDSLNAIDSGKANWLKNQFNSRSADGMKDLLKAELSGFEKDKDLATKILSKGEEFFSLKAVRDPQFEKIAVVKRQLASLIDANSINMDKKLVAENVDELLNASKKTLQSWGELLKKTIIEAGIVDHTEKLNNVGADTYKKTMSYLFDSDLSSVTKEALGDLSNNISKYKKEFMDKIANWQYWAKPYHIVNKATTSMNGTERHVLVASPVQDLISKTSSNMFNSNKWFKTFALAFVGLTGVTLATETFFGKMNKEDVYKTGGKN